MATSMPIFRADCDGAAEEFRAETTVDAWNLAEDWVRARFRPRGDEARVCRLSYAYAQSENRVVGDRAVYADGSEDIE